MQRILDDAQRAASIVSRVAIYAADNELITQSGTSEAPLKQAIEHAGQDVRFARFHVREDGGIDALILARLTLNTESVGVMEVVVDTDSLIELASDYTGLGTSGEFYFVGEITPGQVTVLNALRHRDADGLLSYPKSQAPEHVLGALNHVDAVFRDTLDYRGVRVWAATRSLPRVPGGLIVKIDEDVELARVYELREELIDLSLALAAFAVLAGALMGWRLSRPLKDLAAVVERVRQGERDVRVQVSGEDEVSFLAESFNELMDQMQPDLDEKLDD
jgi:methyl-accepting chemotaxis protein